MKSEESNTKDVKETTRGALARTHVAATLDSVQESSATPPDKAQGIFGGWVTETSGRQRLSGGGGEEHLRDVRGTSPNSLAFFSLQSLGGRISAGDSIPPVMLDPDDINITADHLERHGGMQHLYDVVRSSPGWTLLIFEGSASANKESSANGLPIWSFDQLVTMGERYGYMMRDNLKLVGALREYMNSGNFRTHKVTFSR